MASELFTTRIVNVILPGKPLESAWDVHIRNDRIEQIVESEGQTARASDIQGRGGLLAPSFCHPHIHIDKAFLLAHPKYVHLQVEKGDFPEAMRLTSQAKSQYENYDLLERGQRVIDESVAAGVTHMRAFVEVDAGVHKKCLQAGIALKEQAALERTCIVQLCAFAQLPLFSAAPADPNGDVIRALLREAANGLVDCIGSTPYVEATKASMKRNISWMIDLSIEYKLHLDFHLDYNLNPETQPLIFFVIRKLKEKQWKDHNSGKTIVLGHCTRLALFQEIEWNKLAAEIKEAQLPISFVGLPSSDLFMMRTGKQPEVRGTLNVPSLIEAFDLNSCIGVNNIGNAFTPHGSCDPLWTACQGIAVYQDGTQKGAETLFECVSTRAKAAIGFGREDSENLGLAIQPGDAADLVLFQGTASPEMTWRTRKSVSEAVYLYDNCRGRKPFLHGRESLIW